MKLVRISTVVLTFIFFASTISFSQAAPAPQEAAVINELKALAASVDRLSRILESNAGSTDQDLLFQKLNLAIAYLDFRSRRIESLEQGVQSARNARAQIESTLNVWLKQQEEMAAAESGLPSEEFQQRSEEFKLRIDLLKGRISRLDNEIVVLENKIFELQDQIDSVEEFVKKNLSL